MDVVPRAELRKLESCMHVDEILPCYIVTVRRLQVNYTVQHGLSRTVANSVNGLI